MEHLKGNQLSVLIPTDQQREAIDLWLEKGSLLLHGEVGVGKTLVGVEGLKKINKPVNLIVAPLHTRSGWERTLKGQLNQELLHVNRKNKQGKQYETDILAGKPGYYFVGRELFRSIDWHRNKVDAIIIDECQILSNRKSKTFEAAKKFKRTKYKMAMSATPFGNNFQGAWSVTRFLFPEVVDTSFWRFVSDWCTTEYSPYAYQKITGERVPGSYVKWLPGYIYLSSPYKEKAITKLIDVDLTPTQYKMYKTLEEEAVAWYEDHPSFVDLPAVLYMRLLQTTLAVPKIETWVDDEGEHRSTASFPENTRSTKTEILLDLLKDIPEDEPLLIYTHSKIFAEYLNNKLLKAKHKSKVFDSAITQELIDGLGDDYRILIATQASIAEGTDGLQRKARYEVWMSFSDNRIHNQQCAGRLSRQGQEKQVIRYIIRANNTVETGSQLPRLAVGEETLNASYNLGKEDIENMYS